MAKWILIAVLCFIALNNEFRILELEKRVEKLEANSSVIDSSIVDLLNLIPKEK